MNKKDGRDPLSLLSNKLASFNYRKKDPKKEDIEMRPKKESSRNTVLIEAPSRKTESIQAQSRKATRQISNIGWDVNPPSTVLLSPLPAISNEVPSRIAESTEMLRKKTGPWRKVVPIKIIQIKYNSTI